MAYRTPEGQLATYKTFAREQQVPDTTRDTRVHAEKTEAGGGGSLVGIVGALGNKASIFLLSTLFELEQHLDSRASTPKHLIVH